MPDFAVGKSDMSYSFAFSPTAVTIRFLKIRQVADFLSDCNGFTILDLPNNFKFHSGRSLPNYSNPPNTTLFGSK